MKRLFLVLILTILALIIVVWPGRNPTTDNPPAPITPLVRETEEQVKGVDVQPVVPPLPVPPKPELSVLPIQPSQNKVTPEPVTAQPVAPVADTKPLFYNVVKVVDGDTVTISLNGANETLRLIGMDTPETVDPRKPVQCFGQEASDKAKGLLTGKRVRLEAESSQGERDKYNRLLRYIFLEDGTNYQDYMIRQGYAHEYTYNLPYKYQTQFKQAEDEARLNKKGLWADDACTSQAQPIAPTSPDSATSTSSIQPSGSAAYDCSSNKYNCKDFKTHAEAQAVFEFCGGIKNDIHRLDGSDKDGLACESLP